MTDDHVDEAFDRLLATYGEPKTDNMEGFAAEFRAAVQSFDPKILQLGVTYWIRKDTPFWPRPGQLAAECTRVLANPLHRPQRPIETTHFEPMPERSEDECKRVNELTQAALDFLSTVKPLSNIPEATLDWERTQRPGFEAMQQASRNRMHRRKA